jgi:hypothetical protein
MKKFGFPAAGIVQEVSLTPNAPGVVDRFLRNGNDFIERSA